MRADRIKTIGGRDPEPSFSPIRENPEALDGTACPAGFFCAFSENWMQDPQPRWSIRTKRRKRDEKRPLP